MDARPSEAPLDSRHMTGREFSRKEALAPVHAARRAGDVDALLNIVKRESDWIVRGVAIYDLSFFRDPRVLETLRPLLTAGQFNTRVASIRALTRIRDVSVCDDFYGLVEDDRCHIGIRLTAAVGMAELGDRRVIPEMGRFVVDGQFSRGTMKWAIKKLRKYNGVEAIPVIQTGGSRQLNTWDRLRIRMLLWRLGAGVAS
jgi:hypothetical protein